MLRFLGLAGLLGGVCLLFSGAVVAIQRRENCFLERKTIGYCIQVMDIAEKREESGWGAQSHSFRVDFTTSIEISDQRALDIGAHDFSINIWVRCLEDLGASSDVAVILDKRYDFETVQGYSLYLRNGAVAFQMGDGLSNPAQSQSYQNYTSFAYIDDGQWHMVTVTVERDKVAGGLIYVDGVLVQTFNPTLHPGSLENRMPLFLGRRSSSNDGHVVAELYNLQLISYALDANQLEKLLAMDSPDTSR
jgi:hypothetical protein